ncbi:MAG: 50S ribosomal protein L15 [Phycisphaerae bacterium SM23_30]|nr:MAG: 50S ribosomal protein L15 [Phycisphaerae bacterium SM23_30]
MMIHQITALAGRHKRRKRLGRGPGSGLGKTCGRGHKGQMSRAGSRPPFTKEGGQMPLFRRLPKRGFNNANFACRYSIVNVSQLAKFEEGSRVDPLLLLQAGLIRNADLRVKILGDGELNRRLTVVAHKFSRSAHQKITSAGGAAELAEEKK